MSRLTIEFINQMRTLPRMNRNAIFKSFRTENQDSPGETRCMITHVNLPTCSHGVFYIKELFHYDPNYELPLHSVELQGCPRDLVFCPATPVDLTA